MNNSGKSNVLRALNAFFNDETDPGLPLNVDDDYFRPDRLKKKRKRIRVSIKFQLPKSFKFRRGLEGSKALLAGDAFTVMKEWVRDNPLPVFFLNGQELDLHDRQKLAAFGDPESSDQLPHSMLLLAPDPSGYGIARGV